MMSSNMNDVLEKVMKDGTKEDLRNFFIDIYNKLKGKYEASIGELQERLIKQTQAKSGTSESTFKTIGTSIKSLEIMLIYIKSWIPPFCDFCEAFINGKDKEKDYDWLKEGIVKDLGISPKQYTLTELPVDWNARGATAADHPHYKRLLSKETLNWHYVKGLDIEGFPSLRVFIEFNKGGAVEEVVDGFGIYWYICPLCKERLDEGSFTCKKCHKTFQKRGVVWKFGLREMMLAILEDANDKSGVISAATHRSQTDGYYNDPILQKKKTAHKGT